MIFITGDLHGEHSIQRLSKRRFPAGQNLTRADYVIVAGDFGLLYHPVPTSTELYWLKWLNARPWTTLFVDGNHENHKMLAALPRVPFLGGTAGQVADNIYHLRRGEIYEICGKKIFTFGGAASIDKESRLTDISWWEEEQPSYAEIDYALSNLGRHNYQVDIIIAHTAPRTIITMFRQGEDYLSKITNCQASKFLEHVCLATTFNAFYCGHFHEDWSCGKYHLLFFQIIKVGDGEDTATD